MSKIRDNFTECSVCYGKGEVPSINTWGHAEKHLCLECNGQGFKVKYKYMMKIRRKLNA